MRHVISTAVQMSIANGDGEIDDSVPRLLHNDAQRVYLIFNHSGGQPVLPPDYRTSPDSWEIDHYPEEHPYVAVSFVFAGSQNTQALVEPYLPEYPAHQVPRHAADALEMLEETDAPGNEWERQTMRNQVEIAVRKAMQPMPVLPDHRARVIRAAQVVRLPPHLIQELQREL